MKKKYVRIKNLLLTIITCSILILTSMLTTANDDFYKGDVEIKEKSNEIEIVTKIINERTVKNEIKKIDSVALSDLMEEYQEISQSSFSFIEKINKKLDLFQRYGLISDELCIQLLRKEIYNRYQKVSNNPFLQQNFLKKEKNNSLSLGTNAVGVIQWAGIGWGNSIIPIGTHLMIPTGPGIDLFIQLLGKYEVATFGLLGPIGTGIALSATIVGFVGVIISLGLSVPGGNAGLGIYGGLITA